MKRYTPRQKGARLYRSSRRGAGCRSGFRSFLQKTGPLAGWQLFAPAWDYLLNSPAKGLLRFSSPIDVRSEWPGKTVVSSGRVKSLP